MPEGELARKKPGMKQAVKLFLATLVLAGCSPVPTEPLRVASSPWPGYEPLYMARDLGYFEEDQVNLFELPSTDVSTESFRNHSVDLATMTLDQMFELRRRGIRMRVILVIDSSNGGDAAMATPAIKSLAEIKGKRIAIENGALGVYMLSRMLDAADLRREDVHIIPLAENKHAAFYRQGKADVVITFEPFKTQLAALGAHPVFDSRRIPNEILDVLVVHEDVFQTRRKEVCHFARQWFRALGYLQDQPENALARMGKRLGKTPQEFRAMLDGLLLPTLADNLRMLGSATPEILGPAKRLNEVMVREKQLPGPIDIAASLDPAIQSCLQ